MAAQVQTQGTAMGIVPLRPMSTADVLDGGFRLLRTAPGAVLVPSIVVAVVTAVVSVLVRAAFVPIDARSNTFATAGIGAGQSLSVTGINALVQIVGSAVVAAFLAGSVVNILAGRPPTLGNAWTVVRGRLVVVILTGLVVAVVESLALIACLVPGVWLWALWALAAPAVVVERTGLGGALGRSRALVRHDWWRVFGLRLLGYFVTLAFTYLFTVPFGLLADLVDTDIGRLALTALGSLLAAAVVVPLRAAVDVMLYLDRRVRGEAFDVVLALDAVPARSLSRGWS